MTGALKAILCGIAILVVYLAILLGTVSYINSPKVVNEDIDYLYVKKPFSYDTLKYSQPVVHRCVVSSLEDKILGVDGELRQILKTVDNDGIVVICNQQYRDYPFTTRREAIYHVGDSVNIVEFFYPEHKFVIDEKYQ